MTRRATGRKRSTQALVSILVEHAGWRDHGGLIETVRRAARTALAIPRRGAGADREAGSATILLSGDKLVRDLNAKFRARRKPTNVLAFPALPEAWPYAGDVVLAYGVVQSESKAQDKSLTAHAAHLTIHGVLHLLGYNHHRSGDAKIMEYQEILLLKRLGFENPYQPAAVRRRNIRNKIMACPMTAAR